MQLQSAKSRPEMSDGGLATYQMMSEIQNIGASVEIPFKHPPVDKHASFETVVEPNLYLGTVESSSFTKKNVSFQETCTILYISTLIFISVP